MGIEFYNKYKVVIWLMGVALLAILSAGLYYRFMVFQLLSTDPPSGSTIVSASRLITLSYNKELDDVDKEKQLITSDKDIISSFRVEGSSILIQLSNLEVGKAYTLTLINIRALDGSEISNYVYKFDYQYVPYGKLDKKEQQRQINTTDRGNLESPVIKALPITTAQYYISYKLLEQPDAKGKQEKIIIALLLTNQDLEDKAKIIRYKKAALEFLRANNIDVDDYTVEYAPAEAAKY